MKFRENDWPTHIGQSSLWITLDLEQWSQEQSGLSDRLRGYTHGPMARTRTCQGRLAAADSG